MEDQTKLEKFLRANPLPRRCDCDITGGQLVMNHSVYMGCPKCNGAMSMVITLEEAKLVQERGW